MKLKQYNILHISARSILNLARKMIRQMRRIRP